MRLALTIEHNLDMASDKVTHGLRSTSIRNVCHVRACHHLEELAGGLMRAPSSQQAVPIASSCQRMRGCVRSLYKKPRYPVSGFKLR